MLESERVVCIIPARLKSTRFPKKMLASLMGKPLVQWAYDAASAIPIFDEVAIATDADEIADVVERFGGKYYMTSPSCETGTDRLIELRESGAVEGDFWVNWQGDEPFINEQMIMDLLQSCTEDEADVWTLKKKILKPDELNSPNSPKVVTDKEGYALYFSRHSIPYIRDPSTSIYKDFFKHVGMYAFRDRALAKLADLDPCPLEQAEQLEQLRFLFNGMRVRVHETQEEPFGVDLPEHLAKAEKMAKEFL